MTSTRSFISGSKMLRKSAAIVLGFILAGIIFELTLRAMAASPWWRVLPAVQAQFDAPDSETGYAHRPHAEGLWLRENRVMVRMNAQGLRDRPRSLVPAPGTLRIAVAGDSVTEAFQVEESGLFTLRAEKKLREHGISAELLNFGLSGALPLQQLLFVKHRGLPLQIDAAVFIFNAADFLNPLMRSDSILPAYIEGANGELVIGRGYRTRRSHQLVDGWIGRAFFWGVDHSLVLNSLYTRVKLGLIPTMPGGAHPAVAADPCSQVNADLISQEQLWGSGEPSWAGRRLERFLMDVREFLQNRPVIFMLQGFGNSQGRCAAEIERRTRLIERVRARLESAGIRFVDMSQEINRRLKDPADFRKMSGFGVHIGGGHLNTFGHQVYADVLTDVVLALAANIQAATRPRRQ
jgi:hypothetical protein